AVAENPLALQHASEYLQGDKTIVIAAVRANGLALQFASDELKSDRDVVSAALNQNGLALQHASAAMKAEPVLVGVAVNQNARALQYATDRNRKNNRFIQPAIQALSRDAEAVKALVLDLVHLNAKAFDYVPDLLKLDAVFILDVAARNVEALQYVSDDLRNDRDFMLRAVKQNPLAIKYASDALKANLKLVTAALNSPDFAKNKQELLPLIEKNAETFKLVAEELQHDETFALSAIEKNEKVLEHVSEAMSQTDAFLFKAVRKNPKALLYVSDDKMTNPQLLVVALPANSQLMNDQDFMGKLIARKTSAFGFLPVGLKNNQSFLLDLLAQDESLELFKGQHVPPLLIGNQEFMTAVVSINPSAYAYASTKLQADPVFRQDVAGYLPEGVLLEVPEVTVTSSATQRPPHPLFGVVPGADAAAVAASSKPGGFAATRGIHARKDPLSTAPAPIPAPIPADRQAKEAAAAEEIAAKLRIQAQENLAAEKAAKAAVKAEEKLAAVEAANVAIELVIQNPDVSQDEVAALTLAALLSMVVAKVLSVVNSGVAGIKKLGENLGFFASHDKANVTLDAGDPSLGEAEALQNNN
ncbi:MAG: DUF4116 domain-containing protein, partial [Gammaproteobacteria bacterium]|nr:DUF4116 domain-containing protein [Gammaproteobacteria bacterium]